MRQNEGAPRVLLACVGNALRGDDSFGPEVLRALGDLPDLVDAVDVGIGGMALVHELLAGYDALVIVDAIDRGDSPGTLHLLEPEVPLIEAITDAERRALAADMHQMVPSRVLLLARALGVLPPVVRIVGCQPGEMEEFHPGLTPAVRHAVPRAVQIVRSLLAALTTTDQTDMIALSDRARHRRGTDDGVSTTPDGDSRDG